MQSIKQWYINNYPSDDLGYELTEYGTFYDLYHGIVHGYDVYDFLGVSDSLIRERVFLKLSELLKVEYDYIYNLWLK